MQKRTKQYTLQKALTGQQLEAYEHWDKRSIKNEICKLRNERISAIKAGHEAIKSGNGGSLDKTV